MISFIKHDPRAEKFFQSRQMFCITNHQGNTNLQNNDASSLQQADIIRKRENNRCCL